MALDTSTPRTRRAILAGTLGAVAAVAVSAVAGPATAEAADPVVLGGPNTEVSPTTITNTNPNDDAFGATATGGGTAVHGVSPSGIGVLGNSPSGAGVYGNTTSGQGVSGNSSSGYGVQGNSSSSAGVYGSSTSSGGVYGTSTASHRAAVVGESFGSGTGVFGYSGGSGFPAQHPANTGVYGAALSGRGGMFKGSVAQVKLVPSSATSHPTSGQRGDLFVDKHGRLWFCKGSTTWKQLA